MSEVMLQQTQVSRVVERFGEFLQRFATVEALAGAAEGDVMALWAGMGYYRRARNLQAAARMVVERFGGEVPRDAKLLRELPGVGRYTAGAIASIVYGQTEAMVDGNVARVLLRVEGREVSQQEGVGWAWKRSGELVRAAEASGIGAGVFNEGLMELGAVMCLPRGAKCEACPLRAMCRAAARGKQEKIPAAKARAPRQEMFCDAVVLEDQAGRVLAEQRAEKGMWAGLWQVVTIESGAPRTKREVEEAIGVRKLRRREVFTHTTTHRDVQFCVWEGASMGASDAKRVQKSRSGSVWVSREEVLKRGISSAQRRVLAMTPDGRTVLAASSQRTLHAESGR